jgi:hypothetical protein
MLPRHIDFLGRQARPLAGQASGTKPGAWCQACGRVAGEGDCLARAPAGRPGRRPWRGRSRRSTACSRARTARTRPCGRRCAGSCPWAAAGGWRSSACTPAHARARPSRRAACAGAGGAAVRPALMVRRRNPYQACAALNRERPAPRRRASTAGIMRLRAAQGQKPGGRVYAQSPAPSPPSGTISLTRTLDRGKFSCLASLCESHSGEGRARLAAAAGARLRERVQQEHRLAPGRVDLVPLDGLLRGGAALSGAAPRAAAHARRAPQRRAA